MSKVTPLKAHSARDSFAKLVKFLTHKDVKVEFRGYKPRVETRGDKVIRMVLPELNDNPSKALLEAMHGYLDHECGHIFYTPFKRMADFAESDPKNAGSRFAVTNIVEDIRLEKLLPRDLPGTKENLERMYETFLADMMVPQLKKALAANPSPARLATLFMVPAFRAIAGQRAFQKFMDDNNYWPNIAPLLVCLPELPRLLREMETFEDVEKVVEAVIAVIRPKPKPQPEPEPEQDPETDSAESDCSGDGDADGDSEDDDSDAGGPGDQGDDEGDESDADDEGNASEGDDADSGDDAGGGDEDDEGGADGDESEDQGEGHGDGDGYDDGEGDEDDNKGKCSGDQDEAGEDHEGDDDGEGSGPFDQDDETESANPGGGKKSLTITDALKQLEPTQRRALYAYKKKRLSIDQIADHLEMGEEQVKDVLREARRELKRILDGDSK